MNAISEIVARLQKYEAHYEVKGDTIFVTPATENGFTVSLTEEVSGYTVGFNGWHEEFTERQEALN